MDVAGKKQEQRSEMRNAVAWEYVVLRPVR